MKHCDDLNGDRGLGEYWERAFCKMMADRDVLYTPQQIGRNTAAVAWKGRNSLTLPDITVWSSPTNHHEIKHKTATSWGCYGLETYRFEALVLFAEETKHNVFYTIHEHRGDRDRKENREEDWITANVLDLIGRGQPYPGYSYVNGEKKKVEILYWSSALWRHLFNIWPRWREAQLNSFRIQAQLGL